MHLQIAEKIKTAVDQENSRANGRTNGRLSTLLANHWPAFYYGSVAADFPAICNVARSTSHFYAMPPAVDEDAAQNMLDAYPTLGAPSGMDPEHTVFVAAYGAHLLLDLIWFHDILVPFFVQPAGLGNRRQRTLLHFTVLTYLDQIALNGLPETAAATLAMAEPRGWLPFAADDDLITWRDLIVRQLRPDGPVETVSIFAARLQMSAEAFAANLADEAWMAENVFQQIPVERIQEILETAVDQSIDQIHRYLFPNP